MKLVQGAAALFAAMVALAASAAELDIPEFKSYEQLTYTLITHDEYTASQIPGQTARIDAFLTRQLATPVHTPNLPTTILVLPYDLSHRYFEVSDERQIDFVPARFANFLVLKHSRNSHEVRKELFHEYTHAFLRSQMKRYYPLWLDEGLATLIEASRFHYNEMEIGMPVRYSGTWIPLERLFQLDRNSPEYRSEMQAGAVYYGSWGLVHLAFIEDPAFNKQLFDFLAALNNFNSIEKAVPQSFGMSVQDLDLRIRRYVQQTNQEAFFQVKIPPVPEPKVPPGRNMSEAESLELLAEAQLAAGTRPERLAELIDAAHRKAPDSPRVIALRLRMAVRDRDDSALSRLVTEFEPRAPDPLVARAIGVALFERVRESMPGDSLSPADRERLGRRAFELLDRAVMSKPDDVEAIWGYAMLAARFKQDLPNALQRLNRGLTIATYNPDLAMATALVYEAQGEQKPMIPFLVVTARMTADTAQRQWAVNRVNTILAAQGPAPATAK
jgi:hypothetical protein